MSYINGLKIFPHLIAVATGVDADTAGDTALTFVNGGALNTHTPFLAVVEWGSGVYGAATILVKVDGEAITGVIPLGLDATHNVTLNLMVGETALVSTTGIIEVEVVTPNGAAGTFTIKVYAVSL